MNTRSMNFDKLVNEISDDDELVADQEKLSALITSRKVLDELLENTERNIVLGTAHKQKCRAHNQQDLFKLSNFIYDYEIDEDIYKAIIFRESLIVSRIGDDLDDEFRIQMTPVGGICINVVGANGKQPIERVMEEYEAKLLQTLDAEGLTDHLGKADADELPLETDEVPHAQTDGVPHRQTEEVPPQQQSLEEDELRLQDEYGLEKFLVHCTSQLDVDGLNGGSSITSWIDRNCHTLEELRKEFIITDADGNVNEKSLYVALKKRWYYVKHTSTLDDRDERKLYSTVKAADFVSEGANFILMRYLAIKRFYGSFSLACAYINGDLCKNIYECFGPESDLFNGNKIDCCTIKRTIVEECGLEHVSMTMLTLNGRILKHEWSNCNYVLHANPLANLSNETQCNNDGIELKDVWANDMQLMSRYFDHKETCFLETKSYDLDHPDLRQIIADYVTTILQLRPPDVRTFTFNYFGSFVSTHLPRNEYFE